MDITKDGVNGYEMIIISNDSDQERLQSPIIFTLIGDKSVGQQKIISELGVNLEANEIINKTIFDNDIGEINGFIIGLEQEGSWKIEKVTIKNLGIF